MDAAPYREMQSRLADWSRAAEAHDRRADADRAPAENLARCFELSDFLLRLSPPLTRLQIERIHREREQLSESLRAFEAWRARGGS